MGKKEQIALRIKTMRKSRHMTQEDLANALGQSPSSITMYETGRREPDFETLEALADIFNVSFSSLISESKNISADPSEQKPQTKEARIISGGIDKMSKERREQALRVLQAAFEEFSDLIKEEPDDDT